MILLALACLVACLAVIAFQHQNGAVLAGFLVLLWPVGLVTAFATEAFLFAYIGGLLGVIGIALLLAMAARKLSGRKR